MSVFRRRIQARPSHRPVVRRSAVSVSSTLKAVIVAACLCIETFAAPGAYAQTPGQTVQAPVPGGISLGGRGWSEGRQRVPDNAKSQLELEMRGGLASDYIYRGVTLSDRKPAVGMAVEATYALFYAGLTMASVKLPTQPAFELSVSGGIRPTIGVIDFDLGVTYFRYPGEAMPSAGIDYWEAALRGETKLGDSIRVAGGFAYSPNVSNTGAWSFYAAGGFGYDVPGRLLPQDISASFSAAAGYSWFGNQYPDLGGFPLPAYLNWQAGITFTHKAINLDLRYHDTNLTKENCFVFTGDPNAQPGGRADPVRNPDGLTSRWCGAAFVGRVWFALN